MYHLRLIKGLSYSGIVSASVKKPDVYTEDEAVYAAALATGYFEDAGGMIPIPIEKKESTEKAMPEPEIVEKEEPSEHATELSKMTVTELKQYASIKGITLKSETNKKSILKSITEAEGRADEIRASFRNK